MAGGGELYFAFTGALRILESVPISQLWMEILRMMRNRNGLIICHVPVFRVIVPRRWHRRGWIAVVVALHWRRDAWRRVIHILVVGRLSRWIVPFIVILLMMVVMMVMVMVGHF